MESTKWKDQIRAAAVQAGTYQPCFDDLIATLADVLQERDGVYKQFVDEGSSYLVYHTNNNGSENAAKNPLVILWNDLNTTALSMWRDLGLTPAGLRKINDQALKPKKRSALAEALMDLEK